MTESASRVLVIDDDAGLAQLLCRQLAARGYKTVACSEVAKVFADFDAFAPDAVILDLVMPGTSGLDLLESLRRHDASATIILLSGSLDVATTVRALRAGAEDVQAKPADLEHLAATIERGLTRTRLLRSNRVTVTRVSDPYGLLDESPVMMRTLRLVEHLAKASMPVLIVGEVGTGKRVVAEMLHQLSPRSALPFVGASCTELAAGELERVIFGSTTGAADAARPGLLALAAGGTLFLDEVATLSGAAQAVLHRLLDAISERPASTARLVVSTRRELADDVKSGALRADLYHRLAPIAVHVPPLRSRGADTIRTLASRVVRSLRAELEEGPVALSDAALKLLASLEWPGNVRQLRAVLEDAFVRALEATRIEVTHLGDALSHLGVGAEAAGDARDARDARDALSLRTVERLHIERVLNLTDGHRTEAARLLGITRSTLYRKMEEYGITPSGTS